MGTSQHGDTFSIFSQHVMWAKPCQNRIEYMQSPQPWNFLILPHHLCGSGEKELRKSIKYQFGDWSQWLLAPYLPPLPPLFQHSYTGFVFCRQGRLMKHLLLVTGFSRESDICIWMVIMSCRTSSTKDSSYFSLVNK